MPLGVDGTWIGVVVIFQGGICLLWADWLPAPQLIKPPIDFSQLSEFMEVCAVAEDFAVNCGPSLRCGANRTQPPSRYFHPREHNARHE